MFMQEPVITDNLVLAVKIAIRARIETNAGRARLQFALGIRLRHHPLQEVCAASDNQMQLGLARGPVWTLQSCNHPLPMRFRCWYIIICTKTLKTVLASIL